MQTHSPILLFINRLKRSHHYVLGKSTSPSAQKTISSTLLSSSLQTHTRAHTHRNPPDNQTLALLNLIHSQSWDLMGVGSPSLKSCVCVVLIVVTFLFLDVYLTPCQEGMYAPAATNNSLCAQSGTVHVFFPTTAYLFLLLFLNPTVVEECNLSSINSPTLVVAKKKIMSWKPKKNFLGAG